MGNEEKYTSLKYFLKIGRFFYRKINTILHSAFLKIYNLLPYEMRWRRAQKVYSEWSKTELPSLYLRQIIETGRNFSAFIGEPNFCLDIGCGNGLIGGLSYEEVGYRYLDPGETDIVIGIDPLPLEGPKLPGYKEYIMAICENLPFRRVFNKITIATTLDHVRNPMPCLSECSKVLKNSIFIWTTCLFEPTRDQHHPIRFSKKDLFNTLEDSDFKKIRLHSFNKSKYGEEIFIEARKK